MAQRKRRRPIPILLLWSKKEQLRFCNAVEAIVSVAHDLGEQVKQLKAEREAGERKYQRRRQSRCDKEQLTEVVGGAAQSAKDTAAVQAPTAADVG